MPATGFATLWNFQLQLSTFLLCNKHRAKPEADDLILAREAPAGNVAIVKNGQTVCLGQRTVHLRPDAKQVDPDFLCYFLLAPPQQGLLLAGEAGATAKHVNMKDIRRLLLRKMPGIESQRRAGRILAAYDDLIENNRRRIQLLEQAERLLYREWFVHLRFPGHEHTQIIDGVPEGWEAGTIGDLGEVITGKTPIKKKPENCGSDLPFIKTPDMHGNAIVVHTEESLSEEGAKTQANKTLPPRSILVSCTGTVGAVAFNASPVQTNQQINSIVPASDLVTYWAYFMAKDSSLLFDSLCVQ
jgi:type I restriction enzyme S subunit